MGLAHLNLVSVLSFSKAWYHRPRYRFLVSVLSFFEENAQITKPMSNRRLLSTTQIKSVAHISETFDLFFFGSLVWVWKGYIGCWICFLFWKVGC